MAKRAPLGERERGPARPAGGGAARHIHRFRVAASSLTAVGVLGVVTPSVSGASLLSTPAAGAPISVRGTLHETSPPVEPSQVTVDVDASAATGSPTQIDKDLVGVDGPGPSNLPCSAPSSAAPSSAAPPSAAPPSAATCPMGAVGLRWVRADVSFQDTNNYQCPGQSNPDEGSWLGTDLKGKLDQIYSDGARPLLIVDYTPSCLVPGSFGGFPPSPYDSYEPPDVGSYGGVSDQIIWHNAVRDMATWAIGYATTRGESPPAFEIWNEPDGSFWLGGLPGYLNLYGDTVPAIEQAASSLALHVEVGGPALLFSDSSWIEPFVAYVSANNLPLDFLSWHFYGDYPTFGPLVPSPVPYEVSCQSTSSQDCAAVPPYACASPIGCVSYWRNPALRAQTYGLEVQQVRAELAKYPNLNPALWIDEWNVDAGYDARQDGPFDGAFAAAVLDAVQATQGADPVGNEPVRMAFFDVANSSNDALGNWGMLNCAQPASSGDCTSYPPKPVYWAFDFWNDLGPEQLPVTLSPDQSALDPIGRVGAVASTGTGSVTLLLYNFLPFDLSGRYGTNDTGALDRTVDLEISGLGSDTSYAVQRQTVDDGYNGSAPSEVCSDGDSSGNGSLAISFSLHSEGITLLTITRASNPCG